MVKSKFSNQILFIGTAELAFDGSAYLLTAGDAANPRPAPVTIKPEDGESFHLPELYRQIGCDTIEVVPVGPFCSPAEGYILIIDEEGKLGNPDTIRVNVLASYVFGTHLHDDPIIVGNAILCPSELLK
jgi:hypothetical protein